MHLCFQGNYFLLDFILVVEAPNVTETANAEMHVKSSEQTTENNKGMFRNYFLQRGNVF